MRATALRTLALALGLVVGVLAARASAGTSEVPTRYDGRHDGPTVVVRRDCVAEDDFGAIHVVRHGFEPEPGVLVILGCSR